MTDLYLLPDFAPECKWQWVLEEVRPRRDINSRPVSSLDGSFRRLVQRGLQRYVSSTGEWRILVEVT